MCWQYVVLSTVAFFCNPFGVTKNSCKCSCSNAVVQLYWLDAWHRTATKALVEEQTLRRPEAAETPAEQSVEAGQSMDTEESRSRRNETEVDVLSQGNQPGADLNQTQVHQQGHCIMYPPSFAGNVARLEMVEGLTVAIVYGSGDGYVFGADNEEEKCAMNFGGRKLLWRFRDMLSGIVSPGETLRVSVHDFVQCPVRRYCGDPVGILLTRSLQWNFDDPLRWVQNLLGCS